jgi:hypothetical protein
VESLQKLDGVYSVQILAVQLPRLVNLWTVSQGTDLGPSNWLTNFATSH